MIRLEKVNKYYNKGKKNQIHVIDNTSLELGEKGLVALLGPSGCGKTTLLNVIGGLDKIKKGKIYVNGQKISTRRSYKVDKIRNLNIGYIFQDYKLIDNLSVYDNVAIVLKMIGIKDKNEIKKRVEYILNSLNIYRFKSRPASMLSGGQRQRVGIARALVKDPDIILADEPTGNLDSKNSLEIMNIIKAISKNRLVILVTHETELAHFYADRIIEIEDGKIEKDYTNNNKNGLDYRIENNIYLKDLKHQEVNDKNLKLQIYENKETNLNITLVVQNGNIYIKNEGPEKVEVIGTDSNIELINDHYKSINKEEIDEYNFDFKNIITDKKKKYSSIFNPVKLLKNGFSKVFNYSVIKKILLLGFMASAMFIMFSVSSICALFNIKDTDFVEYNKDYLIVNLKKIKVDDFLSYEQKENINYILPGDSKVSMKIKIDDYYQTSKMENYITGSLSDINSINKDNLIYGRMPENKEEIVVDKMIVDNAIKNENTLKMAGIIDSKSLLDRLIVINSLPDFKIVGISNTESPTIYTDSSKFIDIIYNTSSQENNMYAREGTPIDNEIMKYSLYSDKIEIKKGRIPSNDYEVLVNISNKDEMPLNKEIKTKVNDRKLVVVGYYDSKYNYTYYFTNDNTIKYKLITDKSDLVISSKDKQKTLEEFRNMNLNINDSYSYSKKQYINERKDTIKSELIVSAIILLISLIEIFFMIRSSFLSRIKEIGIYRAIGVKKIDIYRMFSSEIFAITTLAGLPGVIFMSYVLYELSKISYLNNMFLVTPIIVITTIIFVYMFNLIIGLFPVFNVIKKRPAEILSRFDLE